MKTKLLALILLAGGSLFAFVDLSVGIRIGRPPRPRIVRVQPVSPGPGYSYVDGYWYPEGARYRWHTGYWSRPPYEGAAWVAPRHDGTMYYSGHWDGAHGRVEHDHRWDRDHDRDFHHE